MTAKKDRTGRLMGQDWVEAVGYGEGARHDVPSLIMHRMLRLNNQMHAAFSAHLEKRYAISLGEFRVLMALGRMLEAASHEIAELSGLSTMNVSRAVAQLVKEGRVEARTDPNNRRRKILKLTPAGQTLYQEMAPTGEEVANYLVDNMNKDEIVTFSKLITEIIKRLDEKDDQGRSVFIERTRPKGA